MTKRILLSLFGLLIIIGILAGIKFLQIRHMIAVGSKMVPPPETISTFEAQQQSWESTLTAVATIEAVQGVTVAAEQPGKVSKINFNPGDQVHKGDLLVQLDSGAEEAQLRALQSSRDLAASNLKRLAGLVKQGFISQSEYDTAEASLKQTTAQTENIQAIIDKKNIRAPFSGRLGIRQINLGQILKEGEKIVTLQTMDPIFVNFMLPQQDLNRISVGMTVRVSGEGNDGQELSGTITTIDPQVEASSRNIRVQATAANTNESLRPGMYTNVAIVLPQQNQVIAIPGTAVLYAPYSDSVFVVEKKKDEKSGQDILTLRQQFVRLGEKRGDFVAVTSGLQANDIVAATGVFKLRNGQTVVIDNSKIPTFELTPKPENN